MWNTNEWLHAKIGVQPLVFILKAKITYFPLAAYFAANAPLGGAQNTDKYKTFGIGLENSHLLNLSKEVMWMAESDSELLNTVYKEVSERLGMDTAMEIYQMFKGQQINFPIRFFNPARIQQIIVQEYDGTNIRTLAIKYNYSEKTIRRIIKNSLNE